MVLLCTLSMYKYVRSYVCMAIDVTMYVSIHLQLYQERKALIFHWVRPHVYT